MVLENYFFKVVYMSFLIEFIMYLLDFVGSCLCLSFVIATFIFCFKVALYIANFYYAVIRDFFILLRSHRENRKGVEEKE